MTRRSASGHRASRRVERHGGLPLATIQQRWDLAMTMPKARADGVRAYDDDSTRAGATRGGAVAQGKGGRIELPVAEEVGHARSEVSGYRASGAGRVRFGEDIAECGGGGGWRLDVTVAGGREAGEGGARRCAAKWRRRRTSRASRSGNSEPCTERGLRAQRSRRGKGATRRRRRCDTGRCPPDSREEGCVSSTQHTVECQLSARRAFEQTLEIE